MKKKIKNNFWKKLKKPILVAAPMDDVTDYAFRQMFARYGKGLFRTNKFVLFTEFVSADGLKYAKEKDKEKIMAKLKFSKNEHPIVAQIFSSNIENLKEAAQLVERLGFDGVDINMGCPDKSVEKTGSGSALIKKPEHAIEIVQAIKEAVSIPVSVKTRLGYNKIDFDWIEKIISSKPDAITFHLRTRKEMSKVDAHWEIVPEIIKIKDDLAPDSILIANGDIKSKKEAIQKAEKYKVDGVMIGRGLFGNPLFFTGKIPGKKTRIKLLIKHLEIFDKELGKYKSFAIMKKHFKAYISNFDTAKELRQKLMETNTPQEAIQILKAQL